MISERLRNRAEVKGAADIAAGRKKPEYGKESEIEWEAADVIDALVAAAEKARWYVEVYDTREHNSEQDAALTQIDAALALARRK